MTTEELIAHARDQMRLVGNDTDIMICMAFRTIGDEWPAHNQRRLPGGPKGEIIGYRPNGRVVALFAASEVLHYAQTVLRAGAELPFYVPNRGKLE